jgi:hypothetical protein
MLHTSISDELEAIRRIRYLIMLEIELKTQSNNILHVAG